ncbi:MAG TPA: potassium-transporting ATPase subunit KdpB [Methanospirillum sp.]|uniref:potassium-transporting ATPase subunit KdpB n=1 Tax=Methanospirillum sp. TaxID=45200 RepID=UPI002C284B43|nr:potassium-transporting ATPase subunit KdpB [Methanospirillum sp.]HWQ63570.1 potassium-transporting ATPase subunit KdpB [Methanospirillum sp.]
MSETGYQKRNTSSSRDLYIRAIQESFIKLDPRLMVKNTVMFVVEIGSALTTIFWLMAVMKFSDESALFIGLISIWLWFTVLFANFAEALAEGRGKAQAQALRQMRQDTVAKRLPTQYKLGQTTPPENEIIDEISSSKLHKDDLFFVAAGDLIPVDGEIVQGIASVNESAITGESAPVIREAGGDRSAVTGGTTILSDWLIVRVTANPGEGFLDKMISLIEGAKRQRTPNEIALNILLISLTVIFICVCATLYAFSLYSVRAAGTGTVVSATILIALLVCLAPTTIGGLLSAIGIAGMDRLIRRNVITTSGRAIEAAGDVDVLLLDKTGTITLGNREAVEFIAVDGTDLSDLAEIAQLASLADETPEGRSIVVLVKNQYGLRGRTVGAHDDSPEMKFIPFSSQTRMSGVDINGNEIRKGAAEAVYAYMKEKGSSVSDELISKVDAISRAGGTPLVVTKNGKALGVIYLKDIVKGGIKERFAQLRHMGIKTIMITGDNRLTAATIAAEAGVDDFLAEATPESKLHLIREYQNGGRLVAMTGDGTNDAPALAQADVAVAMNTGTQPAREAANMVDLDSNPTKLIEIVEIGKQLLMTRGSLTTFSIANDIAKYFAIIPAAFVGTYPALAALNIMDLHQAILSAVIFNALIIVALIPLALRGVTYKPLSADEALRNNILIYGLGGVIAPFIGIKIIDLILVLTGMG